MPSHPDRVRRNALPAGYRFGDASGGPGSIRLFYDPFLHRMRRVDLPLDERPKRPEPRSWNVIEGEHHD